MGSKIKPGRFDCFDKAEVDEDRFTLLARDPQAPGLLRIWAIWRFLLGEDRSVTAEAWRCANAMRQWRRAKRPERTPFARIRRPDRKMADLARWREDGTRHGWQMPTAPGWKRLPGIRHARAVLFKWWIEDWYATGLGLLGLRTGYDDWVVFGIWAGKERPQ